MHGSGTATQELRDCNVNRRVAHSASIQSFKRLRHELKQKSASAARIEPRLQVPLLTASLRTKVAPRATSTAARDEVIAARVDTGLDVEVTYSYKVGPLVKGSGASPHQLTCILELTGHAPTEAVVYQAAKLVCYQQYHKWRESRLQNLVTWFAQVHPGKLDDVLLKLMNKRVDAAATVNAQENMHMNSVPAIGTMDHAQLIIMARVLTPDDAAAVEKEYAEVFKPKQMSEVDVVAERTAAGKAGVEEKPEPSNTVGAVLGSKEKAATEDKGGGRSGSQQGSGAGDKQKPGSQGEAKAGVAAGGVSQAKITLAKTQALQEECRKKLLDRLIEWAMQRHSQLQHNVEAMERTVQALQMNLEDPDQLSPDIKLYLKEAFLNDITPEQHDKNMALLKAQTDWKRGEAEYWTEKFPCWSSLADEAKQVSATFDLGSSMTSAGLLLQTAAICTVGGPMLPPLLVKVPKLGGMDGFSSADPFPLLHPTSQGGLQPIAEKELLQKLSSLARRHIKLDQLDEFHCIMPKDIPKPKPPSKPPVDPAATPPTAPSAAASQPQAATSQTRDAASQLQDPAIQPEDAASHTTSAASQPLDAASPPQEPAATSHHASSSNTSSSSSNLQDTQSSSPSIGLDETQAPVGSNGASVPKTADGVVPRTVTSTEAGVPAEQQPQHTVQATPSVDEAGKDEEQALSGSVNKSGFEFSGSGEQFKEVVGALEGYVCSGERRAMQWTPPQGPVRLQRLVMSTRRDRQDAGDYHNLQVSDAFGVKPGVSLPGQGPRSCYISNAHLTALMDCIDQYVQQQPAFLRLGALDPVVRPQQVPLLLSVGKVVGRLTAYAALGVMLVAPLVAAFRGTRGRQTGAQAVTPGPPGVVHMAHEHMDQLDITQVEPSQAAGSTQAGLPDQLTEAVPKAINAHLSDADLQQLCQKLEEQLRPPPQVRLGLGPADVLGKEATYQLVVSSQGEVYGCWPTNQAAVNLWSNLPATAQLRSPSYQQRYQQWVTKVSGALPGASKVVDVAPPVPSALVHKQLPQEPLVLHMEIKVDKNAAATSNSSIESSPDHGEQQEAPPAQTVQPYSTSIRIKPWSDSDSQAVWSMA